MKPLARYGLLALVLGLGMARLSSSQALWLTLAVWLIMGGSHTLYLVWATGYRDAQTVKRFIHLLWVNFKAKWRNQSVGELFLKTADRVPDKVMITLCHENGEDKMTFREVKEKSCRVARYFLQHGYKKGEVVALVMENRVDYCCYWIGLSMIGVIPALVNSNLRQQSLLHTITVAKARAVIFSSELTSVVLELETSLGPEVILMCADPTSEAPSLHPDIATLPGTPIEEKMVQYSDSLFYIYTSGTTGLPKAAIITHSRYLFASYCLFCMGLVTEADVLYSALPMYHTAGAAVCFGNCLTEGISVVIRRKFSAKLFWKDCTSHGVTCAQYIGEIARYLYATPESPEDTTHGVRMMFGNGLRPQIWQQFVDRFNIKQINEFYGSTEGNCSVGNFSNKVGAVGFVSVLFPFLLPLGLVKVDEDTREPLRDPVTGLCVPCQFGEPGELVGKIERGHPVRDFQGYADKEATKKKVMADVWRKGDLCFRSGDILVMDDLGWLYFKDRAGDTFR
jgi:solute carrier family 27 fatty acid transporter 1/4